MKQKGLWLFTAGASMALISVVLGNSLQTELRSIPVERLLQEQGMDALKFIGFAFGLPLGIGISILGALISSETATWRVLVFMGVVLTSTLAAVLVPELWGKDLHGGFFGIGGYLILLLVLGLIWYWGRYRALVSRAARVGVDLQGVGYLCFALAAWNLCGAATMPAFALEPEMMLTMGTQAFAIGQMKTIMLLFVSGWLSSLLGFWASVRTSRD